MQQSPPSIAPLSGSDRMESSPQVVRALTQQAQILGAWFRYLDFMRGEVFTQLTRDQTSELPKRHQQVMLSHEFYYILMMVWKESGYVSDADLEESKHGRSFKPGSLNAHSLGCAIAEDKHSVNAAVQRAANYMTIADAYGLVRLAQTNSKPIEIRGTALLHRLVLAMEEPPPGALVASQPSNPSAIIRRL